MYSLMAKFCIDANGVKSTADDSSGESVCVLHALSMIGLGDVV